MIRAIYRADALALLFSTPLDLPNEAIGRDFPVRGGFFSPSIFLEHLVPSRGRRRTWVSDEGDRVRSLVSVRSSASSKIWNVDYLQCSDDKHCYALLEHVNQYAVKRGVRKVFLSLSINSPLVAAARRAGFSSYNKCSVYALVNSAATSPGSPPDGYGIRRRTDGDDWSLFSLYNSAIPFEVRNAEGLTFEEWRGSISGSARFERRTEFVIHRGESLAGWLRIFSSRSTGCFDIMFQQIEGEGLEWLVSFALNSLSGRSPILSVVPAFQWQVRGILESCGFENTIRFEAMVKENAVRVEEPGFIPMRA